MCEAESKNKEKRGVTRSHVPDSIDEIWTTDKIAYSLYIFPHRMVFCYVAGRPLRMTSAAIVYDDDIMYVHL